MAGETVNLIEVLLLSLSLSVSSCLEVFVNFFVYFGICNEVFLLLLL